MSWNVEYTDEFGTWWQGLTDGEQEDITAIALETAQKTRRVCFNSLRPASSIASGYEKFSGAMA